MLDPVHIVMLIIFTAFTVLGTVVNGFIVAVNGIDWVKTRNLNSIDIILISLGAVRFCFQLEIFLEEILSELSSDFTLKTRSETFSTISVFLELSGFWFACWLSVFYCAKIANFRHPLFIFMKSKIPGMLTWLLLSSILASLVTCIPTAWGLFKYYHSNSTTDIPLTNCIINCTIARDEYQNKTTTEIGRMLYNKVHLIPILSLGYSLPFFIFCVAVVLLIGSLWSHTRKMNGNMMGFRNPNPEAHFIAIKVMASFLLFYMFYFTFAILDIAYLFSNKDLWRYVILLGSTAYPSLHSVILILSNSKLKQSLARILHLQIHESGI
ncbi:taste receptor type 2 member 40-like [Microcaecilia unicolor]|uniref:Taste receptor type 2 n=1 Tax=Microcaecilia unicolor TaxID=1415580 RepID=A0A6P7WXH8_9AMPH|nr:taste receptor type 2 member 40-like [Microcaecilia unicolor]